MGSIKCGMCKNLMPAIHFPGHIERKHPTAERVKYIKLPNVELNKKAIEPYVKCRFCPNKIPEHSLQKHMDKCHAECRLCGSKMMKTTLKQHMDDKHGDNQFDFSKQLSQSCSSLSMDDSLGTTFQAIPAIDENHFQSTSSLSTTSSSWSSQQMPSSLSLSSQQIPTPTENIIRVNDWELQRYLRQGRVYTKNGFLYLRDICSMFSKKMDSGL